jgi:tetratricopeptide (TPR) repeat protein
MLSKKNIYLFALLLVTTAGHTQTAEYYYLSGKSKIILKNYKGAVSDFTDAIKLSPNIADYYFARGKGNYNLEDYNGAIQDFSKAIDGVPNYADAYYQRGMTKIAAGKKEDGGTDLKKAGDLGSSKAIEQIKKSCQ